MSIQLFVPNFRVDECLNEIRECLEKGWTGLGFKTVEIENAWKDYTGLPNAHFLNSATSGLHLAFNLFKSKYGWDDGAEVITTPLTFVSTNHAIMYENLKPVFADVDEYLCLDPDSVKQKITDKTKAVIFVGMGGNTGRYDKVVEICKKHNLLLILDAAHMAGSRFNGKHVGHDCDAVVFSFQAVKNLPTADSGMVCFRDAADDAKARKLTWLGINKDTYERTTSKGTYKWKYDVDDLGFKYHGNSIMASIALVQLKYLDRDNAYRRQIASWYTEKLSNIDGISLINIPDGCESSTHFYPIRVSDRDEIMLGLNANDIYPGVHYRDNTEYSMYRYANGLCENAAKASNELLSLPMHIGLTKEDVDYISSRVIDLVNR